MVMASSTPRKGTTRAADIPDEVLQALSRGEIQSATLAESTALDPSRLAQTAFPELSPQALKAVDAACELGVLKCMARLPTCRMRSPTGSTTAVKDQPAWVRGLCDQRLEGAPTDATRRICQRILRNLK